MISKKLTLAVFFSLPFLGILFYLTPKYLLPSEYFLDNFIYIENIVKHHFYHYDRLGIKTFDDSRNLIFNTVVAIISTTFKLSTYYSVLVVNAFSLLLSFSAFVQLIKSRFSNVNFFMMISLILAVQIWSALLGSDVLFVGMFYFLVLNAFWNKQYVLLLVFSSILIAINLINSIYVIPLIAVSFIDAKELKQRLRKRFYIFRLTKTIVYFIFPLLIFFSYRLIYFGRVLPETFSSDSLLDNNEQTILNTDSWNLSLFYLKKMVLPLVLGVVFYFIKQRKKLNIKYYAIFISYILIPVIINSITPHQENIAFQNYYIIYIGLVVLTFLFIRDFRSLSQKITLGIFIIFFAIPQFKIFGIQALQQYNNNFYRIANDIKVLQNGRILAFDDNFISYNSNWKTTFGNNKHTPKKNWKNFTVDSLVQLNADLVLHNELRVNSAWYENYTIFVVPENTKQYIKELKPENSIDYFYYYWREKYDAQLFKNTLFLLHKNSKHYYSLKEILLKHGAKEK